MSGGMIGLCRPEQGEDFYSHSGAVGREARTGRLYLGETIEDGGRLTAVFVAGFALALFELWTMNRCAAAAAQCEQSTLPHHRK